MSYAYRNGSASTSSSSSLNSSSHDTEDDHTIASILAEDEKLRHDGNLGKRLSHLDSIPHTPRVITEIPDANYATLDHERLAQRFSTYGLAEMHIEGDGNCQFRAIADQLFQNQDHHKYIRKEVMKQDLLIRTRAIARPEACTRLNSLCIFSKAITLKRNKKQYESYVPMKYRHYVRRMKRLGEWGDHITLQAAADRFEAKICLVTSFRDTCFIEILPKHTSPSRELWLSFWSEVHYNSLYQAGEVPARTQRKKHWLF